MCHLGVKLLSVRVEDSREAPFCMAARNWSIVSVVVVSSKNELIAVDMSQSMHDLILRTNDVTDLQDCGVIDLLEHEDGLGIESWQHASSRKSSADGSASLVLKSPCCGQLCHLCIGDAAAG